MSKKYIYLLLFIIAALVISTVFLKPGFWKKGSSSFDFLIDSMQIKNTVDYLGEPEKSESDKVYIQKPFATTLFQLSDDSDLSDFYWHITSPSLDTVIKDRESLNYFFIKEGHYLVSLCKDEKNCISKWVYVLKQKDYDMTLASNSVEKTEQETTNTPAEIIDAEKDKKPDAKNTGNKKSPQTENKVIEEKDMTENYRSTIHDLFSSVQNAESTLNNIKQTYPRVSSNNDFISLVGSTSQLKKRITDIYNFKKQIFKVGDSQIERRLGFIKNDYIQFSDRMTAFSDFIAKNPPVEPPPTPKQESPKQKPTVEENSDFSCNSRGQTGISSADWCYNNEFVSTGSVTIKPSRNIQLTEVAVFGSDVGRVTIRITGNDGTDEKKNASLNGGRSVVSLSDLYVVLKKGNTYIMTATAAKKRDNIDASLGNAQKCSKESYSDANVSITYNGAVVFANLKYCY